MTAYIVQSLVWSLGGFLLGWVLGRLSSATIGEPMRLRALRVEHVVGIVVVILAALTMVTSVATNLRLEAVTACQTRFNTDYRDVLIERTAAADRERDAQRRLIITFARQSGQPNTPQAQREAGQALDQFLIALDEADARRERNPLPPERCP